MWIKRARIRNYRCFLDSGPMVFAPGLNVIVGPNDVGKSALLEALTLRFQDQPHRSSATVPTLNGPLIPILPHSAVTLEAHVTGPSLARVLAGADRFAIPLEPSLASTNGVDRLTEYLTDGVTCGGTFSGGGQLGRSWLGLEPRPEDATIGWLGFDNTNYPHTCVPTARGQIGDGTAIAVDRRVAPNLHAKIYAFRAERLNVGSCPVGAEGTVLLPDASNLAACISSLLTRNPDAARKLMGLVQLVFPHVHRVTAPASGGQSTLHIWKEPNREDLAIPLANSGTGIGQVLAMLYVMLTGTEPQVVLVDEPQSFLHPGAVRILFEILREEFARHQVIVSTHAPATVAATAVVSMLRVRSDGTASVVEPIEAGTQQGVQVFLMDVGASVSDVFGADRVLWVEGKTEEACFALIAHSRKLPLRGTKIVAVQSTDDHLGKRASQISDVYRQLLQAPSLLPPHVAFLFDREGRTESERDALTKESAGMFQWLPRRLFENYLLDAAAIVEVLNEDLQRAMTDTPPVLEQAVQDWFAAHARDAEHWPKVAAAAIPLMADTTWSRDVHGGVLLGRLFRDVSGMLVEYRKTDHGPRLSQKLLDRDPSDSGMTELAAAITSVLVAR